MPRMLRIAGSFAVVQVVYWTYALVAVPLIEPPADLQRGGGISESQRAAAEGRIDAGIAELSGLFSPGAWELKSPKILESDQIKLLMQDYRNLGDGRVEIHPCTMIFTPDAKVADDARRKRQVVILEAPEGAVLEFDGQFDLRQMKIGRLIGGELLGRIKIRSDGKLPGPEDDLLIVTRNVQLTEKNIITTHAVDFRYGPHYGRGSQMRIKLLSGDETPGRNRQEPSIGGIQSFELRRLERIHLELGELDMGSGKTPPGIARPPEAVASGQLDRNAKGGPGPKTPAEKSAASDLPVEITCRGPFTFDVTKKLATFEEQVDVLRINPTGPSDQLNCELLSVFFADRTEPAAKVAKNAKDGRKRKAQSLNLQPQRIEARGDPVVVHAPSEQVHARGQRLEYDLQTGRIVLDGTREVMLQQMPSEIHARSLQYQPSEAGQLGRIVAKGPGWLRGQMDQRPDQQLEARWNEQLHVRPDEENQVISLSGGARLKFRGIGQLDAGEIHFWLSESKPGRPDDEPSLRPDRMLAREEVRIESAELSGAMEQLEVWFEPVEKAKGGRRGAESGRAGAEAPSGMGRPGGAAPVASASGQGVAAVQAPPGGTPYEASGVVSGQPLTAPVARQQHFQISGRLLRARMLLAEDGQAGLSELIVEDGVQFVETQTRQADERPLFIRGDRLHVVDADQPHAAVTVTGQPAHFRGRGLALTGANINLNRGTDRLWVDAPGRMDLAMDRDLEGRPLRSPGALQIHWQDSMVFDGRTAKFEESVTVTAPHRYLQTETLEVEFKRRIDFSEDKIRQDPKVGRLLCRGGVFMESLSFDPQRPQKQTSHERMQVTDLTINLDSGALTAGGPGWLTSVRRGSSDPLATRTDAREDRTDATATADDDDSLQGLHVRFQGSITGNVLPGGREMTFHDRVQTAHAPVDSWTTTLDVNDPDALGPDGVLMYCDRLSVNEMTTPEGDRRTMELVADGNTKVEGSTFTALAVRMTYAEAKDLLILKGDGRTDAQLFHQPRLGGPTSKHAAQQILYWPKSGRMKIEGARSLELDRLPAGSQARR